MSRPAGVILAGGRSSRMGVTRKALVELNGQPLLNYVTDRLEAYLQPLLLSCEKKTTDFDGFGLTLVPDLLPGFHGPLMGLYSTLEHLANTECGNGLLLCPCDAPFIPSNLVKVLLDAEKGGSGKVIAVSYQGVLQPTFSLWQNHHLGAIRNAVVEQGRGGIKHLLTSLPHEVVEWPAAKPPPFFNINTPEDLKSAEQWLDRMRS
jgi:molybdopterin-guanine dinucleotide biosynthesis protein A